MYCATFQIAIYASIVQSDNSFKYSLVSWLSPLCLEACRISYVCIQSLPFPRMGQFVALCYNTYWLLMYYLMHTYYAFKLKCILSRFHNLSIFLFPSAIVAYILLPAFIQGRLSLIVFLLMKIYFSSSAWSYLNIYIYIPPTLLTKHLKSFKHRSWRCKFLTL